MYISTNTLAIHLTQQKTQKVGTLAIKNKKSTSSTTKNIKAIGKVLYELGV